MSVIGGKKHGVSFSECPLSTQSQHDERTFLSPVLRPVEPALYRISGADETREQAWLRYAVAMPCLINAAGTSAL
jgi:K+-transporting ATPase A subunit